LNFISVTVTDFSLFHSLGQGAEATGQFTVRSGAPGTGKGGVLWRWWNYSRSRSRGAEAGLVVDGWQVIVVIDGYASQLDFFVCNPIAYSGFRLLVPSHAAG
jgi:hypothetical protein